MARPTKPRPRVTKFATDLTAALVADDRPIAGVVWCDASVPGSLKGKTGLAVAPIIQGMKAWVPGGHDPLWMSGAPMSQVTFRWLGDAVSRVCGKGERIIFAAESDAFGNGIGRGLGLAIGAMEGLLIDLNAVTPGTRLDVASRTWRAGAGVTAVGRPEAKAQAMLLALRLLGTSEGLDHNAAEAVLAACWLRKLILKARA